MLAKVIALVAVTLMASCTYGAYCDDQGLRCRTQALTRKESEDCLIRERACLGSNIWVPECPKIAPATLTASAPTETQDLVLENEIAIKSANDASFSIKTLITNPCIDVCNELYTLCLKYKADNPNTGTDCKLRKLACTGSKNCTWVPYCPPQ